MPLKIAAKVDDADRDYFEHAIRPQLAHPLIEFIGEVNEREKDEFLGNAYAYLFPIDWPEPFGLTMVEAMACGTPVIAMSCGAVPEVVADGVSGFICHRSGLHRRGATRRIHRSRRLPRVRRGAVLRRWMTDGYEAVYKRMIGDCVVDRPIAGTRLPLAETALIASMSGAGALSSLKERQ